MCSTSCTFPSTERLWMNQLRFADKFTQLLEKERETDIAETQQLIKSASTQELQRRGILISGLTVGSIKSALGGKTIIEFEHENMPVHHISSGDVIGVQESKKQETISTGIVIRTSNHSVSVVFEEDLDAPQRLKIVKLANDIPYRRMQFAMQQLHDLEAPSSLLQVLLEQQEPTFGQDPIETYFDPDLNEPQKLAVQKTLDAHQISLIHGPPGTGKTQVCVEIIRQFVKRKLKVLVCAPSNVAVDNLVERLSKAKLDMVRVGHPARVLESVLQYVILLIQGIRYQNQIK
ncbi:IGHMBP2 protein [Gorgonomyces haynaldii]|nr:IGHMBP2 protein [Gorgonomyces haynaldii]